MYENCGPEYYDIFMKQFMQTLGQLGAAIVTSALAVPVYTYYTRNFLSSSKNQSVNEVYNTENENDHTSTTVEGDLQVERDSEDDQSHIGSDDLNETE
jgi:cell division protein FtsL